MTVHIPDQMRDMYAKQLSVRDALTNIHQMYEESPAYKKTNFLIQGGVRCGKTTSLLTAPRPILIHSFDPHGMQVIEKEIDGKSVFADTRFEKDSIQNPTAFNLWLASSQELERNKVFDSIGTYVIDSFTCWVKALANQILKGSPGMGKEGKKRLRMKNDFGLPEMERDDYDTLFNAIWDAVGRILQLPCNVIMTIHLENHIDPLTQSVVKRLAIPGQSRDKIPIIFDELWTAKREEKVEGGKATMNYFFETQSTGAIEAGTRIGGANKLQRREPQNFKDILKKCGRPYEDKVL